MQTRANSGQRRAAAPGLTTRSNTIRLGAQPPSKRPRPGNLDSPDSRARTQQVRGDSAASAFPARSAYQSGTQLRKLDADGVDALKRAPSRPSRSIAQPRSRIRQHRRGEWIAERFELQEALGGGSASIVFRAHDRMEDRPVAVKLLRPEFAADDNLRERLRYEAQLAGSLFSPYIVEVVDFGQLDDQTGYFAMELLQGESLAARMLGPLPSYALVRRIGMHLAQGLMVAHAKGIVHRDLKPDNIFLATDENGEVTAKLMDFGVAKHPNSTALTRPGTVLGTPRYMAPEQAIARSDVDHRADVYSLGAILFELASGYPVFDYDDPMALVMAHLSEAPPELDQIRWDVPAGLSNLVARCLAKDRQDRFPNAAAVLAALTQICTRGEEQNCQAERAVTMLAVSHSGPSALPTGLAKGAESTAQEGLGGGAQLALGRSARGWVRLASSNRGATIGLLVLALGVLVGWLALG